MTRSVGYPLFSFRLGETVLQSSCNFHQVINQSASCCCFYHSSSATALFLISFKEKLDLARGAGDQTFPLHFSSVQVSLCLTYPSSLAIGVPTQPPLPRSAMTFFPGFSLSVFSWFTSYTSDHRPRVMTVSMGLKKQIVEQREKSLKVKMVYELVDLLQ